MRLIRLFLCAAALAVGSAGLSPCAYGQLALGTARPAAVGVDSAMIALAYRRAAELEPLTSFLVARNGKIVGERYYRGLTRERTVNVKSASKSVISALVGIAIEHGKLRLDQPIAELLPQYFSSETDARKRSITVRHLLTMKAGLESTSFDNYGSWVNSGNWARDALRRPFVCPPDTCMVYSTGNSHLLSVILTRVTGLSTRAYANRYLFGPLGTQIGPWTRDPQGNFLGGNEMQLTPRQLLRLGQLYADGGKAGAKQILATEWIRESWGEYATSPWNGHRYGYHWWTRRSGNYQVHFAWGYGGQYVFVVPDLGLVAVATSSLAAGRDGQHNQSIHRLIDDYLIPAIRITNDDDH
jgi:CubicO group peptidase (beta-lactamase class C family)